MLAFERTNWTEERRNMHQFIGGAGILLALSITTADAQVIRTLKPIAPPKTEYGEAVQFWRNHALVVATLDDNRLEWANDRFEATVHLSFHVQESIPGRFAEGTRLALQFPRLLQVRDRPEYLPGFEKGDQFMLLVMDAKGRFTPPEETALYAMMPQGYWMYRITKKGDPAVAETKALCRALSTEEVPRKLELIGVILKGKPSERAKVVLRHGLESLRNQMKRNLEETQRLLNVMQ